MQSFIPLVALSYAGEKGRDAMKTAFFGLVALVLGGCVAAPYYDAYQQYQMAPQQYASPQAAPIQQAAPVYVGCRYPYIPAPHGCVLPAHPMYQPMYIGGYYGAPMMYMDPFLSFRFNFNFGKGGKHHGGGQHHRR